jgi:hypothetical protein
MPKLNREQLTEVLIQTDTPENLAESFGCRVKTILDTYDRYKACIPMLKARLADEALSTSEPEKETLNDWRCRWILKGYREEMTRPLYALALDVSVHDMKTFINDITFKIPIYESDTVNETNNSYGIRKDFLDNGFFAEYNYYLQDIPNRKRPELKFKRRVMI